MKRSFKIVNRNFARIMGNNRKKPSKKGQSKGNSNNESDRQNIEGILKAVYLLYQGKYIYNIVIHTRFRLKILIFLSIYCRFNKRYALISFIKNMLNVFKGFPLIVAQGYMLNHC